MWSQRTYTNILFLICLSFLLIDCGSPKLEFDTNTYEVGQTGPAGGVVFYVTDGGLHGLEAAPTDQGNARYGCFETSIAGADGIAVGTGEQNTADILIGCAEPRMAAAVTDTYALGSYTDWFLPSKDELNLMFLNIGQGSTTIGNVGGFVNGRYWSSTEVGSNIAREQHFNGGSQGSSGKNSMLSIRAVRAF
jgi:hypothetical protein